MARDTQLPVGQLNTAAKPVDAFISPVSYQVAQPGQPAQLPGVQGVSAVSTGGTTYVQGANSFEELSRALRPFSKELIETAQTAGLQFAQWQMAKGEAEFMQQYRTAQLKVDESTEVGETNYAQGARAVGAKDPKAGSLMWGLNPYREIGAQRARSRLAAQQIEFGMPAYVNSRSGEIDYTAPDQGFAALNKIRAEYVAQVTKDFEINDSSPGFQKYTAPSIEKASEKEATRIQEDRVKYYDETMPRQLTQLLRNQMILSGMKGATVELDGKVYTRGKDSEQLYWTAAGIKLNNMSRDFLQKAGPGGMASKWARQAYESLKAEANYSGNQALHQMIGLIRSGEPLRGPDGKPAVGADGQPVYLTWDQLYSQDSLDSRIKYEQAGFAARQNQIKQFKDGAEAAIGTAIQDMPPGPDRANAAAAALQKWVEEETAAGRPPSPIALQAARKAFKEASDLASELVFEKDDPGAPTRYLTGLGQLYGSDFNAKRERDKVDALAAGMKDQKAARQFVTQAYGEIERKEKEVQDMSGYRSTRDKIINDNIGARIQRNYTVINPAMGKPDREESERRQRGAYTAHVNNRIKEKEAQLKRKLNETEVRAVTQQAIDEYGKNDKEALQYLFPGSQAYPNSPSVDPYGTIKPGSPDPDGKPKPAGPVPKVYSINQLDDIPNRAVELRQYRTKPVMALQSVRDVIFNAIDGKAQSAKFERAWRDAGAPNAWDFIQRQLEKYPNYKGGDWTPAEEKKARQRLLSMGGTANAEVARAATSKQFPNIAAIASRTAGMTLDAIFGVAPASAATQVAIRQGGGGWPGADTPSPGGGGGNAGGLPALVSSGEGGWNSVNYGTTGSAGTLNLTGMTIGQVEAMQARGGVFAVGAYQFTPGVLARARRDAGLPANAPMSPENQTRMFWGLATGGKRPALAAYLKGESNDLNAAHEDLAAEWAAVQRPNGRGRYDGDKGGNHASLSAARVRQALIEARRQRLGR